MSEILSAARLALAEAERLRDLHWREVESLRERLDKEEEERGRQYGMRVQAEERAAFLLELLRATVRTGTKDPLLDARLAEEIRSHG